MSEPFHPAVLPSWGRLPAPNRRWILTRTVILAAVLNLLINALIDRLAVAGLDTVSVWGGEAGETSFFGSTVITFFLLPLITCAVITAAIRRDLRLGSLQPLEDLRATHRWLSVLPERLLRRSLACGGLAVAVFTPLLALALLAVGVSELTREQYVAWHAVLAAVLGALVTPPLALYAMAEPSR